MLNNLLYDLRFYYTFCTLISGVAGVFSATRQLQMFQQNSYFPSRYLGWLKENGRRSFLLRALILVIIASLSLKVPQTMFFLTAFLIIYAVIRVINAVKVQKKSIKKLVFTAKIKRMYSCLIGIYLILALCQYFLSYGVLYYFLGVALLFGFFEELEVFLVFALTYPLEKQIKNHYIKDAKKILASYGGKLKVIGVTGSYGKTGTKYILNAFLLKKFNTVMTPGSYNTPMGVVKTVRENLSHETEIFICEMGAKNKGDIKEICDIVHPDGGIITSVGEQHLETFRTVENVLSTKFELYYASKNREKTVFVNGDNENIRKKLKEVNAVTYGLKSNNDFYADNIVLGSFGQTFTLHWADNSIDITTRLLGKHNLINLVGAAALALSLGVTPEQIKSAAFTLKSPPHRLEIKPFTNGCTLIDDAYNANPEGSIGAVEVLSSFKNMKKVIITPGLIELGEREEECNKRLGLAAGRVCDIIILVGEKRSIPIKSGVLKSGFKEENLFIVPSFKEALAVFTPYADKDTVVLFENDLPDNYLK